MNTTPKEGEGHLWLVESSPTATPNLTLITYLDNFTSTPNWTNATDSPRIPYYTLWHQVIIGLILSTIIFGTIIGNSLVILAVGLVKKLRTPSNILIVSLAVSDFSVALLVMPFAAVYELTHSWILGQTLCDLWVSLDVLLCTSSILNLCMISIDRYFVITRPFTYTTKRTPKLMGLMITIAWVSSALISIPPLLGWNQDVAHVEGTCGVSQELGYQMYATICAFYCPLTVMIIVYGRIFYISSRISKKEARSNRAGLRTERPAEALTGPGTPRQPESNENQDIQNGSTKRTSQDYQEDQRSPIFAKTTAKTKIPFFGQRSNKNTVNRETKATQTLGVIMGCFTACWLPFFIVALLKPCNIFPPMWLDACFLWLGYLNSFLNPLIYAKFNRDFRKPFKEILLFRCRGLKKKVRSDSYFEQYGASVQLKGTSRRER